MSQVTITLFILVAALVLFVTELVPLGITPLIVLSSLSVSGVLSVKEVLTGFSNDTTVMVLFMFPVGEALFRTGVCEWIGRRVIRGAGKSEVKLVGFTMLAAAFLSAFTSNTGTTIVMAPLIMSVAREARVSASTLLLPLAFGASFGGMLTLVGTPPNAIVRGGGGKSAPPSDSPTLPKHLFLCGGGSLYMMFVGRKIPGAAA